MRPGVVSAVLAGHAAEPCALGLQLPLLQLHCGVPRRRMAQVGREAAATSCCYILAWQAKLSRERA